VILHGNNSPIVKLGRVKGLVELAKMSVAIVGIFALSVDVVDDQGKRRSGSRLGRPFEHLNIAVRIAECGDGPPPQTLSLKWRGRAFRDASALKNQFENPLTG
jgi:hypothetical protein